MKTKLFLFLVSFVLTVNIFAQSPNSFNFQAVVRNAGGNVMVNTPVQADIKIWQSSPGTTLVLDETYNVTTNGFGLINLMVGSINQVQMAAIDWAAGPYYIEVIIDGTSVSTTQLLSVPYALHAKTAETITESDPFFTGSPANGITTGDITSWNNKLDNEVDGSITNELQLLSISNDTVYLSDGGFVKIPAGFDGQYSSLIGTPTNVSTFTNDAGYLTSEVDGSVTNELQALTISNDTIYLSNGGFVKLPAGFDGQYGSLTGSPTNVSSFTNDAGYLTSFTEVDPKIGINSSGYSPKWDGTSLVTGSVFQDATGKVGIGTTTPGSVLDLSGGFLRIHTSNEVPTGNVDALEMGYFTSGGYAFLQGYNRGTNTFLPIEFSGSTVGFRTGGSTAMTINETARVGIGTVNPSTKLEVVGVITAIGGNSTLWNESYSWGNHATAGYSLSSHTHLDATTSTSGFMSATDKTKLNGLQNANITAGQGINVSGSYPNITVATSAKPAVIRWNVFDTYIENDGWAFGNSSDMFGGINPSSWTDGNYRAVHLSSDKEVLRTLFNKKCYPGKNAMVFNETFFQYSSTNGKVVVALMRVKNNTSSAITWPVSFYYSCYGGWNEYAGIALNGNEIWQSGGANTLGSVTVNMSIPANRISTIIVTSPSGPSFTVTGGVTRVTRLAFYNNCLQLPAGLEFVDDLDYATGGWEQ